MTPGWAAPPLGGIRVRGGGLRAAERWGDMTGEALPWEVTPEGRAHYADRREGSTGGNAPSRFWHGRMASSARRYARVTMAASRRKTHISAGSLPPRTSGSIVRPEKHASELVEAA